MDDLTVGPTRHKLDVDAFYRMAEVGILGLDDRVELIDGELIDMAPVGSAHSSIVSRVAYALMEAFGDRSIVQVQSPIRLGRTSEPQPDVSALRPRADWYEDSLPTPPEVLLLVEVADSSLGFDRSVKLPLYAEAAIAEVWIVNVKERCVERYSDPVHGSYESKQRFGLTDQIALALAPDIKVGLTRMLGHLGRAG